MGAGLVIGAVIGLASGNPICLAFCFVVGGVIGLVAKEIIESDIREDGRRRRRPEYLRLLEQWERAYYCQRHDLVFVPGDDWTGSPADFRTLMN